VNKAYTAKSTIGLLMKMTKVGQLKHFWWDMHC